MRVAVPKIRHRARTLPGERRPRDRRAEPRDRACAGEPPAVPEGVEAAIEGDQRRERAAPGPQDRALFSCRCGSVFQAPVTASVRCPHCGEPQAW
jgi:hypothetical protein